MDDGTSGVLLADRCEAIERLRAEQARLLHGELGGLLVAARISLAALGSAPDARVIARLDAQLAEALAVKQRVVEALRPGLLDHFGPGAALASHFETLCRPAGVTLQVDLADKLPVPAPPDAILLYRIGEAALTEALRTGVQAVSLSMAAVDGQFQLQFLAEGSVSPSADTSEFEWLRCWIGQRGGCFGHRVEGLGFIVKASLPVR